MNSDALAPDPFRDRIKHLLLANAGGEARADSLTDETDLFAAGLLDSFGMVMFIEVLADEFSLEIPGDELRPENFASINAIAALARRAGLPANGVNS